MAEAHGSDPGPRVASVARSLTVERFHSDIRIYRTAAVEVTETIRYRFEGSWQGVFREIPIRYRTPEGFGFRLQLELQAVEDGEGQSLRHETSREDGYMRVKAWVPGARDAVRTVVFRYRVENALNFFDEYEELYWNVTGTESSVPIESASAVVHLPVEVEGIRARAYTGPRGSTETRARVRVRPPVVEVETTTGLGYREGLTVGVAWEPGVVSRPGLLTRAGWFLRANLLLLVPLLAGGVMYRLWFLRGRDPESRSVAARYEPPEDLSPGEVGVMLDQSPDPRDITATLVHLAVRGHLVIEEESSDRFLGLGEEREYALLRRTEPEAWAELAPHERRLLRALFDGGLEDRVQLSELENDFYEELPDIREGLFHRILERKYYERRPDKVRRKYIGLAAFAGVALMVGGQLFGPRFGWSQMSVVAAAFLTGGVVFGFGWVMPARTRAGARIREATLGFQEFLERVEEDHFRRMIEGPEDFERLLPYAMALGVEKEWAAAFEDVGMEPPDWYRGGSFTAFRPTPFVARLDHMAGRAGTAMTSSPRGSGGSSFSGGGGFSGGGVGGGGTGGF